MYEEEPPPALTDACKRLGWPACEEPQRFTWSTSSHALPAAQKRVGRCNLRHTGAPPPAILASALPQYKPAAWPSSDAVIETPGSPQLQCRSGEPGGAPEPGTLLHASSTAPHDWVSCGARPAGVGGPRVVLRTSAVDYPGNPGTAALGRPCVRGPWLHVCCTSAG